ncbi:helix-turn-helix domain-containing protein [Niallia circulans]|uniref:Helix-turn-helix domain-containing protein n=1 Tax=Niallia circulans TaxID=1397 RepID=A0A553SNT2_NIACI|nr:RodZ domain-containing protein [Niallia circulans]TRZ38653.1 helix-turn-helix domain-containing protein [Niallia circulans]
MSELGNRLKEARLAKGLSLEELQEMTKIQTRYLVGIEEGNFSMMPGNFYARAFIKQYAEAVDLPPEDLFEEYKSEIPSSGNEEIPEKLSRVTSRQTMSEGGSKIMDILPKVLITLLVVGVIALAWFLIQNRGNGDSAADTKNDQTGAKYEESATLKDAENEKKKEENATDQKVADTDADKEQATEEEKEEETPKQELKVAETSGSSTVYELKNADKFSVKLVSTGQTWVNMQNGKGYSFYQGILDKDGEDSKTVDYSKETEAILVIGNSSQTDVYVNDEKLDFAVSPSDSVRQDITIKYVKEEKE